MITYEYACAECKHEWEEEQKITDNPTELCPKCQRLSARRLISSGNFVLKGDCWARDLYGSKRQTSAQNG